MSYLTMRVFKIIQLDKEEGLGFLMKTHFMLSIYLKKQTKSLLGVKPIY